MLLHCFKFNFSGLVFAWYVYFIVVVFFAVFLHLYILRSYILHFKLNCECTCNGKWDLYPKWIHAAKAATVTGSFQSVASTGLVAIVTGDTKSFCGNN